MSVFVELVAFLDAVDVQNSVLSSFFEKAVFQCLLHLFLLGLVKTTKAHVFLLFLHVLHLLASYET